MAEPIEPIDFRQVEVDGETVEYVYRPEANGVWVVGPANEETGERPVLGTAFWATGRGGKARSTWLGAAGGKFWTVHRWLTHAEAVAAVYRASR